MIQTRILTASVLSNMRLDVISMPADIHTILLADLLPKLFRGGVEVKDMRLLSFIVGLKSVGGSIAPWPGSCIRTENFIVYEMDKIRKNSPAVCLTSIFNRRPGSSSAFVFANVATPCMQIHSNVVICHVVSCGWLRRIITGFSTGIGALKPTFALLDLHCPKSCRWTCWSWKSQGTWNTYPV